MSSFRRKPESTYPHPQGRQVNPSYGQLPRCRLPAKAGIHVPSTLRYGRSTPAYGQLPRCRLSGESRNLRIPNPQGQKVNSSLRATPQMSSFRRKPESTYPQPSGTAGQSILRATPQMSSSGESRNPRTLNPEVRQVNPAYGQLPRCRLPAKAGIHVPPTLRDGRSIHPTGNSPDVVFRRKPESTYPQPSGTEG